MSTIGVNVSDPISAGINLVDDAINKIWPNKTDAEKAKLSLLSQELSQQFQLQLEQAKTNTAEAANKSPFVAGWRSAIGWVLALGFGWKYLGEPVLADGYAMIYHATLQLPALPPGMEQILFGLLGISLYHGGRGVKALANKAKAALS